MSILREASSPDTPPLRLKELSQHPSGSVVRAVAQNPNTDIQDLLFLMESYPHEVLQNPSFPLLLLGEPDLWSRLSEKAFVQVLRVAPSIPLLELGASSQSLEVLLAVAKHPMTPVDVLQRLVFHEWGAVGSAVLENPCLPSEFRRLVLSAGWFPSELWPEDAAPTPVAPEALRRLSEEHPLSRHLVAFHPNTPDDVLEELSQNPTMKVAIALFARPGLSKACQASLLRSQDPWVRSSLARYQDAFPEIVERLLQDPDPEVVLQAVRSERASQEGLLSLSARPEPELAAVPICRGALPLELRLSLLQRAPFDVMREFAISCPSGELIAAFVKQADRRIILRLLDVPQASVRFLQALVEDPDPEVKDASLQRRLALAKDPLYRSMLREDPDPVVRALAQMPPSPKPRRWGVWFYVSLVLVELLLFWVLPLWLALLVGGVLLAGVCAVALIDLYVEALR